MYLKTNSKNQLNPGNSSVVLQHLKDQRYNLTKKIQECRESHDQACGILNAETRIQQVIRDLEDVSAICFEGHPDKRDSAQQVIHHLQGRVEESEKLSKSLEGELSRLHQDLQRVNEKLSAARAGGR